MTVQSADSLMEARAIVDRRLKRITIQEEIAQLIEALKVTIENPEEKNLRIADIAQFVLRI